MDITCDGCGIASVVFQLTGLYYIYAYVIARWGNTMPIVSSASIETRSDITQGLAVTIQVYRPKQNKVRCGRG